MKRKLLQSIVIGLGLGVLAIISLYLLYNHTVKTNDIHVSQNEFGKFWIREFHDKRYLIFDEDSKYLESCIPINNSNYLALSYSKDIISSLYIKNTSPKHVLMIGLGGGVIPTTLLKLFPDMKLDIVEIDHDVLNIAKQYFFFKPTENTNIFIEDALIYVNRNTTKRYDMILVDAGQRDVGIPLSFRTAAFANALKTLLSDDGILSINTIYQNGDNIELKDLYFKIFRNLIFFENSNIIAMKKDEIPFMHDIEENAKKWDSRLSVFGIMSEKILPRIHMRKTNTNKPL